MRPLFIWYRASVDEQNETWLTRLPLQQDRPWLGYGLAVVVAAIAFLVRVAFDAVLPPGFPYVTFFPAVVAVAVLFGPRPGMVTAALGLVLAWYFFIPPQGFGLTVGTAAALGVPTALTDLLAVGGCLILPVGAGQQQSLVRVRRTAEGLQQETIEPAHFVPMLGGVIH